MSSRNFEFPNRFNSFQIEHVITVMTGCGVVILICRGLIPDENLVWQPEVLLSHVASELHYVPSEWKGQVRAFFYFIELRKSAHVLYIYLKKNDFDILLFETFQIE